MALPILASAYNELSDAESPQIPITSSPIYILDTAYVSPDPANVRECTRQLKLYSIVAMKICTTITLWEQTSPWGVRALKPRWSKCYVYLKRGETLRVRRGERKTTQRVRVLESMLRQVWRGYRYQVGIAFPELDTRFMFIYEG